MRPAQLPPDQLLQSTQTPQPAKRHRRNIRLASSNLKTPAEVVGGRNERIARGIEGGKKYHVRLTVHGHLNQEPNQCKIAGVTLSGSYLPCSKAASFESTPIIDCRGDHIF